MEENKNEKNKIDIKSDNKKVIVETVIAVLAILFVAGLIFFGIQKYRENQVRLDDLENRLGQNENPNPNPQAPGDNQGGGDQGFSDLFSDLNGGGNENVDGDNNNPGGNEGGEAVDEYEGWKTYINRKVGYELKYPADWDVKEIETFNEVTEQNVKYINIYSPEKKYLLYWGLKRNNDPFGISERTGVGAGDLVKDGKIKILDTSVDVNKQVWEGKIQEYFFPNPISGKTSDGAYTYGATFDKTSGNPPDSSSELALAKKILESVEIINRNGEICASTLTADEKAIVENSPTYHNSKYGYLLKYPSEYLFTEKDDKDVVGFFRKDDQIRKMIMEWVSGNDVDDNEADLSHSPEVNKIEHLMIACQDAKLYYMQVGMRVALIAIFKANGVSHMLGYTFPDAGAAVYSDNVEMFKAYLKTIQFGN